LNAEGVLPDCSGIAREQNKDFPDYIAFVNRAI
jgi:hypothetical protein